jgi:hypothetical protein
LLEDAMDDQKLPNDEQPAAEADDVEGHSLALVLGMGQADRNRQQNRTKKASEETLPPLTKPFPRMKDDKRS